MGVLLFCLHDVNTRFNDIRPVALVNAPIEEPIVRGSSRDQVEEDLGLA